ncbi:thiosulfate sulfurtransferase/rhodanese-like domain-containing protein 3 isoform X1 [Hyla sarda]|uniref:thiosulfate sulfurtransferase/rhodanese-like domain-containing protein 3 isoform X1 n=1 Tax=Hyla sarda TaxID=327740 RepID=UPI0024C3D95C|nr:thiosulfate sulfurtransferase/rhodanese-like domain-containing protein 3 isoform X1 [Hyla sarda]
MLFPGLSPPSAAVRFRPLLGGGDPSDPENVCLARASVCSGEGSECPGCCVQSGHRAEGGSSESGFSAKDGRSVNYEELKDLLKKDGVVLVDVREPWEIKEYGIIKGSIHIPLGDLVSALQMTPKHFEEKYKMKLPEKSNTLVFSCLAGIRSGRALDEATSLGYNKVYNYAGGFEDWAKHESGKQS